MECRAESMGDECANISYCHQQPNGRRPNQCVIDTCLAWRGPLRLSSEQLDNGLGTVTPSKGQTRPETIKIVPVLKLHSGQTPHSIIDSRHSRPASQSVSQCTLLARSLCLAFFIQPSFLLRNVFQRTRKKLKKLVKLEGKM